MLFVFDLDGTLADATNRLHHIKTPQKKKNWDQFFEEIPLDPPFQPMIDLVKTVCGNNTIVFQTGRPEKYRRQTIDWLTQQGITPTMFTALLMRENGNYQRNIDMKMHFLEYIQEKYMPSSMLWFEDSPVVVEMLNKQGVLALSAEKFMSSHQFELDKYEIPNC